MYSSIKATSAKINLKRMYEQMLDVPELLPLFQASL